MAAAVAGVSVPLLPAVQRGPSAVGAAASGDCQSFQFAVEGTFHHFCFLF